MLAAEVAPLAKTGGLADVAGALPKALAALGHDVRVVMPAYASVQRPGPAESEPITVPTGAGRIPARVLRTALPGTEVPLYLIAEPHLFDRPSIYGYGDDPYRFAFYGRAALEVTAAIDWRPDVVHAHDWHAAPALTWLATSGARDARLAGMPTVFTIHNLAHQGRAARHVLSYLGVDTPPLAVEGWSDVNFMARGIHHASAVTTVSPTYAREIMTPEGGAGLDALLRSRGPDVHGILNGLDVDVWNPATDEHLDARYDADRLPARVANKRALQRRLGLTEDDQVPLVGMVTRLDAQKGLGIIGHVLHLLMSGAAGEMQCVVLGSGAQPYEEMLAHIAAYHVGKMSAVLTFASDLASQIYGGSDLFLMPSLFEPCGLSQMIAMRYGSVPVVRATGGLADTVIDGETGFAFGPFTAEACWGALQRALLVLNTDPASWRRMQTAGMRADYSWSGSAHGYAILYERAIAGRRG